jgi:hypothetical protein
VVWSLHNPYVAERDEEQGELEEERVLCLLRNLVGNDELQTLLKDDKDFQSLICS